MGQLYLSNVDFLKNGVPASIIATFVRLETTRVSFRPCRFPSSHHQVCIRRLSPPLDTSS